MDMEKTDQYFRQVFEEKWGRNGARWWQRFLSRRANWESQKKTLYEYSETWQMVDHGWEHSTSLYLSLPRFLWAIESFSGKTLINNAAELYAFLVSAFLHDIGMHFLSVRLNNDFRRGVSDPGFPYQSEELLRWLNPELVRLRDKIDHFSDAAAIRLLHPEIGAWMCDTGQLLANESERKVIAQIVFRHAKRIPKENAPAGHLRLDGENPESVRIGFLAALISLADACQVGRNRAVAWQKHLERLTSEIATWESVCDRLEPTADDEVKEWCCCNLDILKKQPAHILKHTVVERVSLGPKGFIVVPAFWDANRSWFDFKQSDFQDPFFTDKTLPTRAKLLRLACEDILGELGGPEEGRLSVSDYLRSIFDMDIVPNIPIINADTWSTNKALAAENDELWKQYFDLKLRRTIKIEQFRQSGEDRISAGIIRKDSLSDPHRLMIADVNDILEWGWSFDRLLNELIALDYEVIADLKEEHEGHYKQWSPVFSDHPDTWRLLIEGPEKICGYWHFVPLFETEFELSKRGELLDHQITTDKVKFFELPGCYDIYIVSMCMKPQFRRPPFQKVLFSSFVEVLTVLANNGIFIRELTANAYTNSGDSICRSLGMQYLVDHKDHGKIYWANFTSLLGHSIFKINLELVKLYNESRSN